MDTLIARRGFLAGSLSVMGGTATAALAAGQASPSSGPQREFYELRIYRLLRGPMVARAERYFAQALVPALRRLGTGPVGVFSLAVGQHNPSFYVLIPHPTGESALTASSRLGSDPEYREAAGDFARATPSDPPYLNVESRLLAAASFMPRLEVPAAAEKKQPRLFELRTYRSHSKAANRKKMEMFGEGGELAIFRRTGLQPVFFAETLFGPDLPNLTYMLVYADDAARQKAWSTFVADPEWKKLSSTPGYTDPEIVADISNVLLRPASASQV
ncbi:MAG: NIPSNAP family protein [Phycisphaerae bacterium]|jgi:hypothetical protein